jgi:hypothetical protein
MMHKEEDVQVIVIDDTDTEEESDGDNSSDEDFIVDDDEDVEDDDDGPRYTISQQTKTAVCNRVFKDADEVDCVIASNYGCYRKINRFNIRFYRIDLEKDGHIDNVGYGCAYCAHWKRVAKK